MKRACFEVFFTSYSQTNLNPNLTTRTPFPMTTSPKLRRLAHDGGFTLVELVLVITIISILVGGGIYYMMGNVDVELEKNLRIHAGPYVQG